MTVANLHDVLESLATILDSAREDGDPVGLFAALYQAVTRRVQAGLTGGLFDDAGRMEALNVLFANRYFDAVEQWRAAGAPARCWRVAFEAAAQDVTIIQHLLLGMNAHINLDLAVSTAKVAVDEAGMKALKADYGRINAILAALIDEAQAVIDDFSPLMWVADRMLSNVDEKIVNFSLKHARNEAWKSAQQLVALPAEKHRQFILGKDREATSLAQRLRAPGGFGGAILRIVRRAESRDMAVIVTALGQLG